MTRSTTGRRRDVMPTLELLAERFPACFSVYENRRRPLKIGIHLDILAALDGAVTPDELALALRCYVANRIYRSRLIAGAERIGLDGTPVGTVTPDQVPPKVERKTQPAIKQKVQEPPKPAPPKRLSFADLRAAAARRKAAAQS